MEVCGDQVTSTALGGARGAKALRTAREQMVVVESGSRRDVCSGRLAVRSRSAAASALGAFGDRLRVPAQTPQPLGASRAGVPGPILRSEVEPSSAPSGAWLQQSAVQWHSPTQQQEYSVDVEPALLVDTAPRPANCTIAISRDAAAVILARVVNVVFTNLPVVRFSRRFAAPGPFRGTNRREKGRSSRFQCRYCAKSALIAINSCLGSIYGSSYDPRSKLAQQIIETCAQCWHCLLTFVERPKIVQIERFMFWPVELDDRVHCLIQSVRQ